MKKKLSITLLLLVTLICALPLAGCGQNPKEEKPEPAKVYSFKGESNHLSISNGVMVLDGEEEICHGGDLAVKGEVFDGTTSYKTTIYLDGKEEQIILSNSVNDQTGDPTNIGAEVGQISGDFLADEDRGKLEDNLWFKLETTNQDGKNASYKVKLEVTEVTGEAK